MHFSGIIRDEYDVVCKGQEVTMHPRGVGIACPCGGQCPEEEVHENCEDSGGDDIPLLDSAVAIKFSGSSEGVVDHQGGVAVQFCNQVNVLGVEAREAHCLPEHFLVGGVECIAPVNP